MNADDEKKLKDKLNKAMIRNTSPQEYEQIKNKVEGLLLQNDEVLDTIDVRILMADYDDLTVLLNVLTVYPDIQDKIVSLRENEYKMFVSIVKGMDKAGIDWISIAEDLIDNLTGQSYRRLFEDPRMINRVNTMYKEYRSDDVGNVDINLLEKMTSILTNGNLFNVKSLRELENLDRNKKYNDLLIGNIKDTNMSNLSATDKLKNVLLLKRFGHTLEVAETIYDRYLEDYDEIMNVLINEDEQEVRKYVREVRQITNPEYENAEVERILSENKTIKSYIFTLKTIMEETDIRKLKKYYDNSIVSNGNLAYRMDSYMRKFFCREKNKVLYRPQNKDKVVVDSRNVYLVQDDFKISMTSLNSYSKAWDLDVKKVKNHGMCTNICANNNLNHAPIRGACIAFNNYDERSLYMSAPWDIGSSRFASNMNISRPHIAAEQGKVDVKFHLPNSQMDRIRRRSGEDIYERRELDPRKIDYRNQKFKKQPAYAVYFSEESVLNYLTPEAKEIVDSILDPNKTPTEILTAENLKKYIDLNKLNDLTYRTKLIEQYAQNDKKWSNPDPNENDTLKEADKRGVEIVIVDRTHTMLKERLKIDEIEKNILEFDSSSINNSPEEKAKFISLIRRLIVESENCRAGLNIVGEEEDGALNGKIIHKELRETLFSKEIMSDRLSKIEGKIAILDDNIKKECYKDLAEIMRDEVLKYDKSWFEIDPGFRMRTNMTKYMSMASGRDSFDVKDSLSQIDPQTGKSGGQIVCEAIADIRELNEYPATMAEIHGQKHINNVILFSYLIAKGENTLDSRSIDLLIQAAKFHDVGRDGNWNGMGPGKRHDYDAIPHANPSALGAEYYMSKEKNPDDTKKYTKEEIAIVKTAISYHEVSEHRHNVFNESRFNELCRKYGVAESDKERAKNICIYLKDADAVDRTRFMVPTNQKEIETIPEHKKYERKHWFDELDTSYLRTQTSLLIVDEARAIHMELMKKGCEVVYDEYGNVKPELIGPNGEFLQNSPLMNTEIIDMLNPYKDIMLTRASKYGITNKEENEEMIANFLKEKEREQDLREINEINNICRNMKKSVLAKIRDAWKKFIKKVRDKAIDVLLEK